MDAAAPLAGADGSSLLLALSAAPSSDGGSSLSPLSLAPAGLGDGDSRRAAPAARGDDTTADMLSLAAVELG